MREPTPLLTRRLPKSAIDVEVDIDVFSLASLPTADESTHGFTDNRSYFPVRPRSGADLRAALEQELKTLEAIADELEGGASWEDALSDVEYESSITHDLDSLEFGVAGAVLALASSGCVTAFSCRGHGRDHAQIQFATTREIATVLRQLAVEAGCGLTADGDGLAWLYSPSVLEMIRFADLVASSNLPTVK